MKGGKLFINTVTGNKKNYSKRQIKGAEIAKELYAKLARPSMKNYKWIVLSNQIKNCPVTLEDIDIATNIWGKDIAALKGKTTSTKSTPVAGNPLKVPKELLQLHRDIYI
jgi:hypothetical protein